MSASPCEREDTVSEREEGDMGCSALGGRAHLVGIRGGMCVALDEIRVFVLFGLRTCGLKKSMDCEVKV